MTEDGFLKGGFLFKRNDQQENSGLDWTECLYQYYLLMNGVDFSNMKNTLHPFKTLFFQCYSNAE